MVDSGILPVQWPILIQPDRRGGYSGGTAPESNGIPSCARGGHLAADLIRPSRSDCQYAVWPSSPHSGRRLTCTPPVPILTHGRRPPPSVLPFCFSGFYRFPTAGQVQTQRIKPDADKYTEKLTVLHQMLLTAMKCKLTVDVAHVDTLRKLLKQFETLYFGHSHKS